MSLAAGKFPLTSPKGRVLPQRIQGSCTPLRGTLCKQFGRPAGRTGWEMLSARINVEEGVRTVVTARSASTAVGHAPPVLPAEWEKAEARPEGLGMAVSDAFGKESESFGQPQSALRFVKYHGLGNDFLLVDNRDSETPKITPDQAIKVCDRNFGVGGDGVIFVLPGTDGSDFTMRIYNSDGSEPEMCGNGIRCMARFIAELDGTTESRSYNISTLGGLMVPKILDDGQVCVDMGPPILEADKIPTRLGPNHEGAVVKVPLLVNGKTWNVTCVSMGNPHCIVILDDTEELGDLPLASIGPQFEKHDVFPAKTNTEFVQVLSRSSVRMRVWERGAGATLACGTGACALVVAAVLEGRTDRKCHVELPGGPLEIEWGENNHLYMTGPAQKIFAGIAYM